MTLEKNCNKNKRKKQKVKYERTITSCTICAKKWREGEEIHVQMKKARRVKIKKRERNACCVCDQEEKRQVVPGWCMAPGKYWILKSVDRRIRTMEHSWTVRINKQQKTTWHKPPAVKFRPGMSATVTSPMHHERAQVQLPGTISNGGYFKSHTNVLGTQCRLLK